MILLSAVFVLLAAQDVYAWGPATHTKIALDVLSQLQLTVPALATLLLKQRKDFIFGNIAADVVFAKRLSRVKQFCHQWSIAFQLLDDARSDAERAFASGYLTHLASDTVAHGKYLPRQMTVSRTTFSFGHLYWELRADSTIGTHYWSQLREVLEHPFEQHVSTLENRLTNTLLPFNWNLAIFYRLNNAVSHKGWLQTLDVWYHRSRWELPEDVLAEYRAECADRAVDVLVNGKRSPVAQCDPNGTVALNQTRAQRKLHRKMARAGVLLPHVLAEATIAHAPRVNSNGRHGRSTTRGAADAP